MRPDGRRRARGNLLWLVRPEPNKLRIASVGEGGRPMKQEWKRMGANLMGCMMSVRCTRGI